MKTIVRLWHQFCAIYTVSALLLLFLNLIMAGSLAQSTINARAFMLLFLFALLFALANLALTISRIAYALRVLLHFALVLTGGFCFLYLPNNIAAASSGKLLMLLLMAVLYWIVMGLYLAFSAKRRALEKEAGAASYRSVYSGSKGK